jgi:rhodanese-related sulfurtransferase
MIRQINGKHMKTIRSIITVAVIILAGLSADVSLAESDPASTIPDELIARKLKTHDPSLAISVEAVLYKLKRNQPLTLVDVRRKQDFERLHIPDSINIPLHAVKTKTYLKSATVVLVNEGFRYAELETECRRLAERGFAISIIDGGLPAWKRQGGQLAGDLFALDEMKAISPQKFFREKDYENTVVVDISPMRSETSTKLISYARHFPVFDNSERSKSELRKLIKKNKPFQSVLLFNESGEQYEKAEKMMNRMGIESFYLQGGVVAYQKYLEGLMLSWKPRDSRMKTIGNCKPCGEKIKDVSAGSEIVRKK